MPEREKLMGGFGIGDWTVLPERGLLRSEDGEERIEPKVMEVLVMLASANGGVVSKQQLMDEVWGDSPSGDEVITRCIAVLRNPFKDDARHPRVIETLSRRGYRLMLPVSMPVQRLPGSRFGPCLVTKCGMESTRYGQHPAVPPMMTISAAEGQSAMLQRSSKSRKARSKRARFSSV